MKTQILSSNRYNITWIEFRPEFGIATKADVKQIDGYPKTYCRAYRHRLRKNKITTHKF